MRKVTLNFIGDRSETMAEAFYTWLLDGGLEDTLIEGLSTDELELDGVIDFDNQNLEVVLASYLVEDPSAEDDELDDDDD
ncbi:hypothetical protein [Umboniibacter marinipuniceus]|uniref:Uncharacterized protein n=1 Tax=Umboniibacter marinipuniceus TaxID=569599 RepID=A0A3M0A9P3_9GAMM|nr:hypothetical protein [Umboniibacter marinipuniceus]RMA81014.1 hypothetical protein DFR27_0804 [Umboniibacter marinipuniceus]